MKKILLSSAVAIALLTGCGDDKKVAETKPVVEEVKQETVKVEAVKNEETVAKKIEEVKTPEVKLVEQVKDSASKVVQKVSEESKKVVEALPAAVESVTEKVAESTKEVTNDVALKTQEVTNEVLAKTEEVTKQVEKSLNTIVPIEEPKVDLVEKGKGLYLKCAGCHGASAEKPALGKSQVIKGWDASKIVDSLKGYKAGTYGGVMKGVMKGQVTNLNDEDIKALGAYIATF